MKIIPKAIYELHVSVRALKVSKEIDVDDRNNNNVRIVACGGQNGIHTVLVQLTVNRHELNYLSVPLPINDHQ